MRTNKTLGRAMVWLGVALGVGLALPCAMAKTTAATNSGDWATATIWNNGAPVAGDDVAINASKSVTVSTAVGNFNSFTVNGTLTFTNWDTSLSATTVTIASGGSVTLPPAFTTSQMSNRVYFICTDFTLASNATINVDAKGWSGGTNVTGRDGSGPGGGQHCTVNGSAGGGYGGTGGTGAWGSPTNGGSHSAGGVVYGSKSLPLSPGSGGGGGAVVGGAGGGLIWIEATNGNVILNGTLTANGGTGTGQYGGGSGGGIYLNCRTLAATNGTISATGAAGSGWAGGGGGGRIAIVCDPAAQQASTRPTMILRASGGAGGGSGGGAGGFGTIFVNEGSVVPSRWTSSCSLSGFTNSTIPSLTVTNARVVFEDRAAVTVSSDLTVSDGGRLDLYDADVTVNGSASIAGDNAGLYLFRGTNLAIRPSFQVAGNLTLSSGGTNAAKLYVYAGTTNTGVGTNYDVSVSVGGTLGLVTNAWVYPTSNPTNGGSIKFSARNVTLAATNTGFMADGRGWGGGTNVANYSNGTNGFGSGGGLGGSCGSGGGGYGGNGGHGATWNTTGAGGGTYGSSNAPVDPGSGGGSGPTAAGVGGAGGGLIWIEAPSGTITMMGPMTANGSTPSTYGSNSEGGGGSGGGIYLKCKNLVGSADGKLSAKGAVGANTYGGPGGGGRIAVWFSSTNSFLGSATASGAAAGTGGGGNTAGANGTVVWQYVPPKGTMIMMR